MINERVLSYLAGCMDSDGYFSIKKSKFMCNKRVNEHTYNYVEYLGIKQTTPEVPYLFKEVFGFGNVSLSKGGTTNSKPLYSFVVSNKSARIVAEALIPYLLIKKDRAKLLLELGKTKDSKYVQHSYWFQKKYPDWQNMEMITSSEVTKMLNYTKSPSTISICLKSNRLIAIPVKKGGFGGSTQNKRFPKILIEILRENKRKNQYLRPKELTEWRESIYQNIRETNKMGVNGTPVYHRILHFAGK